ncbi:MULTISPECIES: hypothetical protein [Priestia]|uniref:hypothetical protein n=1 Tax=Priestia TaxID=2800373 RepID=UPI001454F1BD|nr:MULTISPECIES: hypothetical protein [Priestia]MBY0007490.1 hypothetical protein [Priestia aryabhattai]MBY0045015.1 hypothetical protein [Priestia aryabhattai]NLR42681.1 hypothetical protein [Priestia megaterium]WDC89948.1 hypothetical protein PSR56_07905 [Priestia megaterium]
MRSHRYTIKDSLKADEVAKDLELQLDINRMSDVRILSVNAQNEILVQMQEENEEAEDVIDVFMKEYKTEEIIE